MCGYPDTGQGKGTMRIAIVTFCAAITTAGAAVSQTPSRPLRDGPTFDVISIRRHPEDGPVSNVVYQRPDGGFSLTNHPASALVARAYGLKSSEDIVGLPTWAQTDLYDVSATSSLSRATTDDRLSMWRAMLVNRFGLIAHLEKRKRPAYDLVLARADGRLGRGLTRVAFDCDAEYARRAAEAEAAIAAGLPWPPLQTPDPSGSAPPCTLALNPPEPRRTGWLLAGEGTIAALVISLRAEAGRLVVDKTGLPGSYHVRLNFDSVAPRLSPDPALLPDAGLTVIDAVQQQLGLRLRSSWADQDTLVVDHIERPTEN
jgi:uncharacterized protein (TIGR03435 family)